MELKKNEHNAKLHVMNENHLVPFNLILYPGPSLSVFLSLCLFLSLSLYLFLCGSPSFFASELSLKFRYI